MISVTGWGRHGPFAVWLPLREGDLLTREQEQQVERAYCGVEGCSCGLYGIGWEGNYWLDDDVTVDPPRLRVRAL